MGLEEERETRRCWRWSIVRRSRERAAERDRSRASSEHSRSKMFFFFSRQSSQLSLSGFRLLPSCRSQCTRSPSGAPRSSRPARRHRARRRAAAAAAAAAADERSRPGRRCRRHRRPRRSSPSRSAAVRFLPLRSVPRFVLLAAIGSSTFVAMPPARRRTSRGARSQVRGEKRWKSFYRHVSGKKRRRRRRS